MSNASSTEVLIGIIKHGTEGRPYHRLFSNVVNVNYCDQMESPTLGTMTWAPILSKILYFLAQFINKNVHPPYFSELVIQR